MAFFSFRRSGENPSAQQPPMTRPAETVDVMRRRAKHRLVGAVLLVLAGVIGFPWVFDTQPRPSSVDVQIDLPEKTKSTADKSNADKHGKSIAPSAVRPAALPASAVPKSTPVGGPVSAAASLDPQEQLVPSTAPSASTVTKAASKSAVKSELKVEPKVEPKTEAKVDPKAEPKVDAKPATKPPVKVEAKPEHKPEQKPEQKPEPKASAPVQAQAPKQAPSDDGARAKSLLEGKDGAIGTTSPPATATRYVIQVGAFADLTKAREARLKLERAGLKTYTHVAQTKDGERTRVRVGPFATKAEADKVASKVKTLDLPAAILTL
jgi:DedD protein